MTLQEIGTTHSYGQRETLNALLDRFASQVPHVTHVVAVSSDGLPLAASTGLDDSNRDQLCASACTTMSIHEATAKLFGAGPVINVLCDMAGGATVYQTTRSGLVILMALVTHQADLAQIQHDLEVLGDRLGDVLNPGQRAPAPHQQPQYPAHPTGGADAGVAGALPRLP